MSSFHDCTDLPCQNRREPHPPKKHFPPFFNNFKPLECSKTGPLCQVNLQLIRNFAINKITSQITADTLAQCMLMRSLINNLHTPHTHTHLRLIVSSTHDKLDQPDSDQSHASLAYQISCTPSLITMCAMDLLWFIPQPLLHLHGYSSHTSDICKTDHYFSTESIQ